MRRITTWLAAMLGFMAVIAASAAAEPGISAEDKADLKAFVKRQVWGGFDTKGDIREAAIEQPQPPVQAKADLEWLDQQIDAQWSKKRAAEATWTARTDFDRLDDAFKALRSAGILAMHNAGNTQSDAREDAVEEWHRLGGAKSGLKGFIFYHGQDVEHVIADGKLYIGFSTFPESPVPALELVQQTVSELKKAGFTVTAPPDVNTRILVAGIDWKKRSPQ